MKVLNICVRIDKKSGGGSVAALELAKVFALSGFDVDNWIIVDPSDGELLDTSELRVEFFETKFGSSRFRFSLGITKALRTRLKKYDVVVLSGLYLYPNTIAAIYCGRLGVPYILFPYDSFNPEKMGHSKQQKAIYRFLFDDALTKKAALVQAANEAERRQVVSYTNRPDYVFVAPFGFNVSEFSKQRPAQLFQNMVPWEPEGTKTILYLARVSKTKGVETLIDAYETIAREDDSFRLLIVGPPWDEEYDANLRQRCHELIAAEKIHFAGMVADDAKYACFQNSYIYVLPSYSENFGITVLEALSNGLVSIVTEAVPWEELVHHHAGYRVPTRDAEAIARSVLEFARLPDRLQLEMRRNAQALSLKFGLDSVREVYREALTRAATIA